jgi:hypothetical protein
MEGRFDPNAVMRRAGFEIQEADVKEPMALALAIVVACSVWLFAEKTEAAPGLYPVKL